MIKKEIIEEKLRKINWDEAIDEHFKLLEQEAPAHKFNGINLVGGLKKSIKFLFLQVIDQTRLNIIRELDEKHNTLCEEKLREQRERIKKEIEKLKEKLYNSPRFTEDKEWGYATLVKLTDILEKL